MLITLGEADIKTLSDFADLASDELVEAKEGYLRDFDLTNDDANELIMGELNVTPDEIIKRWPIPLTPSHAAVAAAAREAAEAAEATRLAEAEAAREK